MSAWHNDLKRDYGTKQIKHDKCRNKEDKIEENPQSHGQVYRMPQKAKVEIKRKINK